MSSVSETEAIKTAKVWVFLSKCRRRRRSELATWGQDKMFLNPALAKTSGR